MKLTELQEKWLHALESGEYKQGREVLRTCDDRFCCLGVALEVCDISPEGNPVEDRGQMAYRYRDNEISRTGCAPIELIEKLPLFGNMGDLRLGTFYGSSSLAVANDKGATFAEIAAFIRANPEQVFTKGADDE